MVNNVKAILLLNHAREILCNTSCYVETSKLQLEVTTWLCDIIVEYIYQAPAMKRAPTTLILHKMKCSKGPTYIKVQLYADNCANVNN